jgi:hypothetical protein
VIPGWASATGAATLLVRGHGLRAGELRDGDTVLARAQVDVQFSAQSSDTPWTALRLGPCTPPQRPLRLLLEGFAPLEVPAPRGTPLRVAAARDLDAELARALDALLAVDAEFTRADSLDTAEVVVAAADDPADPRPRLVLTPGAGDAPRHAVLAPSAPLHLSLRDGKRRAAPALPALAGPSNVWIADAAQGATLAAATLEGTRRRVHIVAWLLLPITRADAPELLGSALRTLGGRPQLLLALAGQPLEVAAGHGDAARLRDVTVPAVDGAWHVRSAAPGEAVLATAAGPRALVTLAPQSLASARDVPPAEREAHGGAGAWSGWLLALLVVLLAADAYFFHRGRLP